MPSSQPSSSGSKLKPIPTVPAGVDPLSVPQVRAQVEAARGVAHHLLKGVKTIGLYRHNEARYGEFLGKAHQALTTYLETYGALAIKVELTNFTLLGQDLFTEDSPIPYRYFKDGVRQLIFRDGFTVEELVQFTVISLSDPDRGAEDLNAQLWRAQMPHLEYIMVEGFRMDEFSEEEVQVEVAQVVDYLQKRLRAASADYLRFARVSEADLDMQLEGVDQMRGLVVAGVTADAALKARVQKDIGDEENQRLFPKLVSAVFQVVEAGVDDAALLTDMFTQLLDAMLLQEDFPLINQVVLKLRAMTQRQGASSAVGKLLVGFTARMAEEQRLRRLGEVLRARVKSAPDIQRYLATLQGDAVPVLLDVLESVELPENRALLVEAMVPFAKQHPDPFVERLRNEDKPQMQRDMLSVLEQSKHPDRLRFFQFLLKSKNLALRLEVMAIVARGRTGEARKIIVQMLEDENLQVRLQAARVLPEFDREKAFLELMRLVKDKAFEKRSPQEREAFYAAIGSTGQQGALAYFGTLLTTRPGLFNKQQVVDDKKLALAGLAGACTIQTAKLLQEVAEDAEQPPEVVTAARLHLGRVRRVLFGETTNG